MNKKHKPYHYELLIFIIPLEFRTSIYVNYGITECPPRIKQTNYKYKK